MTAEATCTLVLNLLMELFKGNLSLLNAFSTDTCNQMRATWKGLSLIPEFQHCFFIPCNSHGLQLLIKDLLVEKKAKRGQLAIIPTAIQTFFKKAYRIVVAFRKALLQLAILWTKQVNAYGKEIALISSVMTRWGIQFRALMLLSNNMRALQYYTTDAEIKMDQSIIINLQDNTFWNNLGDLLRIIQPLHEAQKESEASGSRIGLVAAR